MKPNKESNEKTTLSVKADTLFARTSVLAFLTLIVVATALAYTITRDHPTVEGVELVQECTNKTWEEQEVIKSRCTDYFIVKDCIDAPLNLTCTQTQKSYTYDCTNGTKTVQKTKEECTTLEYRVGGRRLSTSDYGCSVVDDGKIYVTCDSKYDGNGDGICSSGESCVKFGVVGSFVEIKERNSGDTWKDDDPSYFIKPAEVVS